MFHSQIAAPSARSSRHHPSLCPPPKHTHHTHTHTHARFYVVSSGKAGLSCVAAANSSVPARFILLAKVTWLKEKPNASPSGSEKGVLGGGGAHSELRDENTPMPPPPLECHPAWQRGGRGGEQAAPAGDLGTAGWATGAGAPVSLPEGAPEVSKRGAEQSPVPPSRSPPPPPRKKNPDRGHLQSAGLFFNSLLPCCCGGARLGAMERQAVLSE